ncbi:MAG: hypothetical protein AMS14_06725 [Planctomycetes bacterium DG_20]|nr:MAG: hypothetical protein AMS14_06725 [Planctomycetes bacterium DG_20]
MEDARLLHEVVLDALEFHARPGNRRSLPPFGAPGRIFVLGSGNAFAAGRIIFRDRDAVFADEGQYAHALEVKREPRIECGVVISSSGGKDAPDLVKALLDARLETYLLTCNEDAPAACPLDDAHVVCTPTQGEPITYNTHTYLGMILAHTAEDPGKIRDHIVRHVEPVIDQQFDDLESAGAFFLLVHPEFDPVREMLLTKFDELFGPMVNGRCYTPEQTAHAKTLVPWDEELFISFDPLDAADPIFGKGARLNVPMPKPCGPAAMVAIGYYVIGRLQEARTEDWFRKNADAYKAIQQSLIDRVKAARAASNWP